ncbi:MAG: hypothetical protein L6Q92_04655 [Phycisphaerae bacterium]|nr:hypothetical protein [Phycisphaerae bacterium]
MSAAVLLDRQLARLSGVPLDAIAMRRLGAEHADRIDRGLATLESVAERLAFVAPPFDLGNIAATADDFGAALLMLDYLQRIRPPGERQDAEIAWTVARIGGGGGGIATAAFAMITSKTGSSPPLAVRGRAGHDGCRRGLDPGRRRGGV